MKTLNEVQSSLQAVEFDSIAQWVCELLKVFEFPDATIKKVVAKVGERKPHFPGYESDFCFFRPFPGQITLKLERR